MQTAEEKRAYQRQWYLDHQADEQAKARDRAAAKRASGDAPVRTPEERRRLWANWYPANREQRRVYMAGRGEANREAGRRYREAHPDAYRRRMIERYHRRRASGSVSARDWARLVIRHGGRCAYCGRAAKLTEDHVVPLIRGGRHTIGNLLPSCQPCNSSKGSSLLVEWRRRRVAAAA